MRPFSIGVAMAMRRSSTGKAEGKKASVFDMAARPRTTMQVHVPLVLWQVSRVSREGVKHGGTGRNAARPHGGLEFLHPSRARDPPVVTEKSKVQSSHNSKGCTVSPAPSYCVTNRALEVADCRSCLFRRGHCR